MTFMPTTCILFATSRPNFCPMNQYIQPNSQTHLLAQHVFTQMMPSLKKDGFDSTKIRHAYKYYVQIATCLKARMTKNYVIYGMFNV